MKRDDLIGQLLLCPPDDHVKLALHLSGETIELEIDRVYRSNADGSPHIAIESKAKITPTIEWEVA
jgi:hypothetical protein